MSRSKYSVLGILFVVACLLAGCHTYPETKPAVFKESIQPIDRDRDSIYHTFEEALSVSTNILTGRFIEYQVNDAYTEMKFKVLDEVRGHTGEKHIYVFETSANVTATDSAGGISVSYVSNSYNYVPGHRYLLVLQCKTSVYYDHDRYMTLGGIFMPLDDEIGLYMYGEPLARHIEARDMFTAGNSGALSDMSALCSTLPPPEPIRKDYSEATKLPAVVTEADYVLEVSVDRLRTIGELNNTETYVCTVQNALKGNISEVELAEWNQQIYVVFFPGDAEIGETYLLALNRSGEASRIFTMSSRNSVYAPKDALTVQRAIDAAAAARS